MTLSTLSGYKRRLPGAKKAIAPEIGRRCPEASSEKTEVLYHFLVESLADIAVFVISPSGHIASWNAGAQHIFGYSEAEVMGLHFGIIFCRDDIDAGAPAAELAGALRKEQMVSERWHVRKDGMHFWGTNTVQPIHDDSGILLGFAKLVRDVTENHVALQSLSNSEERLRLLIESVHEYAIFSVGLDNTITSWNSGAQTTFGYAEHEIIGRPVSILFNADDIAAGVPDLQLREALAVGFCDDERWLVRKDATRFLSSCKLSQLKRGPDGQLRGCVKIAHDITERKRVADDLRRRALYDGLTKLPNRAAFYENVYRAIASMKRHPANRFAVLFIDLDHFKSVNDTHGHVVADRLLELIARRLEQCVRSEDVIARLGGDEFAVLLNGFAGLAEAIEAGDRIGLEMARPVSVDGHDVRVTASVGIAQGRAAYNEPEDILRDADAAMYVAKTQGRARAVVFEPAMNARRGVNRDIGTDLSHALERGELRVVYQPIMQLATGSLAGFEALVRWQHPRHGLLQPADFIERAETSDAIIAIDRWVFRVASLQLKQWQFGRAAAGLRMSVNFSRKQFSHSDLIDDLRRTLRDTGVDPRSMRLEITESGIIERSERTSTLLRQIRTLGIELQIDDFGTGYASLESLGHMPVTALKIDRSFIAGMTTAGGAELVRSIASLAHNLGLAAIAEGVENAEQLRWLERYDCDFGQGFLFSRPLDAAAAGDFLSRAGFEPIPAPEAPALS